MKISKKVIMYFVECGEQFHKHVKECLDKDCEHDFENDELNGVNWGLYFGDMHERFGQKFGDVLYSMIEYARCNCLTIENIENALRALNIEVE